jgi:U3 small nucleolar RNA-associated protein 21
LPTLPGVESRFVIEPKDEAKSKTSTKRLEKAASASESIFLKTLVDDDAEGDCE